MPYINMDPFTSAELTAAVNKIPAMPGLLGQFFEEKGISTTHAAIDVKKGQLQLVPDTPRNVDDGLVPAQDARQAIFLPASHLVEHAGVTPDDLQDRRAFGSDQLETAADRILDKQVVMRRNIEVTKEYHRVGAVKGKVLDADGTTVLYDIYKTFGLSAGIDEDITWPLDSTGALNTVLTVFQDVCGTIDDAMGGFSYNGIAAICGKDFWDHLISNPFVRDAYNLWAANLSRFGDNDFRDRAFTYGGITWYRYGKKVGGKLLVEDAKAHVFPYGPGIFQTFNAPADYNEAVNTIGMPFYSKIEERRFNKGYDLEVQANPLTLCMFPEALVTLTGEEATPPESDDGGV